MLQSETIRKYDTYRDSKIPWIGIIPQGWSTIRIKNVSWLKGRIGWQGLKSDEYQDTGAYLITGTDFDNGKINWNTCVHITKERFEEAPEIHIKENDLLITKDGTVGKVALALDCPHEVSLNSGVLLIRNSKEIKYNSKFLYYVLLSDVFWNWFTSNLNGNSTIIHLYQEQFYNFSFCLPSIIEQQKIADYLDKKCGEIDRIIETEKSVIEKLKEYKQSIITEAVTKGLNKSVPLKDSNVEWIGKIPQHWEICKLLKLYKERKCKNKGNTETNVLSLSYGNIKRRNVENNMGLLPESFETYNIIVPDNIVLRLTDLQNDHRSLRCGLVKEQGIITSAYVTLEKKLDSISSNYYYRLLHTFDIMKGFYGMGDGVRQNLKYDGELCNLLVVRPSQIEQQQIAEYLDKKCSEIDKAIANKEQVIEKFTEYKKSLIYECVTGKKRVA